MPAGALLALDGTSGRRRARSTCSLLLQSAVGGADIAVRATERIEAPIPFHAAISINHPIAIPLCTVPVPIPVTVTVPTATVAIPAVTVAVEVAAPVVAVPVVADLEGDDRDAERPIVLGADIDAPL